MSSRSFRRSDVLAARGRAAFNAGRPAEALGLFEKAMALGDPGPELRCFAAHSLEALGRGGEALARLRRLTRESPAYRPGFESLAELLRSRGRLEEAQRVLDGDAARASARSARRLRHEIIRERALRCKDAGELAQASRLWRRLLEFDPGDREARGELRETLFKEGMEAKAAGRWDFAEGLLRELLSREPRWAPARRGLRELREMLFKKAVEAKAAGRWDLAEGLLRGLLSREPRSAPARRELGQVLRTKAKTLASEGDLAGAVRAWEALAKAAPREPEARRGLAQALCALARIRLDSRRWPEGLSLLERSLAVAPEIRALREELEGTLRARSRICETAGRWEQAFRLWRRADELIPPASSQRADRFRRLAAAGRYEQASREGERLLDLGMTLCDFRAFWAPWDVARLESVRAAHRRILDRILSRRPDPWAYYYRGFMRGGQEGLRDFDALSRFPQRRYGWMQGRAGQSYMHMGLFTQALPRLQRAIRREHSDWRLRAYLAEALLCLGREADAFAELRSAYSCAPPEEKGQVVAWRAALHLWSGRYAAALRCAERACALGARPAFRYRGAATLKLGRKRRALRLLDDALRRYPDDGEALVWRAEAKRELGFHREAVADLSSGTVQTWSLFNRGLAKGAQGDVVGMRADFDLLPRDIVSYLMRRQGWADGLRIGPAQVRALLESGLRLSRGYRRPDSFGNVLWMK